MVNWSESKPSDRMNSDPRIHQPNQWMRRSKHTERPAHSPARSPELNHGPQFVNLSPSSFFVFKLFFFVLLLFSKRNHGITLTFCEFFNLYNGDKKKRSSLMLNELMIFISTKWYDWPRIMYLLKTNKQRKSVFNPRQHIVSPFWSFFWGVSSSFVFFFLFFFRTETQRFTWKCSNVSLFSLHLLHVTFSSKGSDWGLNVSAIFIH